MQQVGTPKVFLAELTLQPIKVIIYVRVVRKWSFNGNDPAGVIRYIGLVLADEKGDSIYAQIPQTQVARLNPQIQNGRTYMISKFTVRVSKSGYVPFERKYMVEFNAYTTIDEVPTPSAAFPEYVYQLTPFSNINPVGPAATKLIDLLGIITYVGNARSLQLMKKDRVAMIREIIIKDQSEDELKITLWDDRATEFCLPAPTGSENAESTVILLLGCQPATVNKITQAYGGNACCWYFNPQIREAQPLYSRLQLSPVPIHISTAEVVDADQIVKPIVIEHKTLAELNQIDPYEIPQTGYKCTVTITAVHATPRWWYVGCQKCGKAAEVETVPFLCRCGWKECTPLYKLSFEAQDETANARFFCYDTVSRRIIRRNIDFMLRESRKSTGLPQHFNNLISRKYTLVVGVTNSSFQDPSMRTFLVKSVSVDYHERAFIAKQMLINERSDPLIPSSSSATAVPQLTAPNMAGNQLQPIDHIEPPAQTSTPPPPVVQETPATKNADQNRVGSLKPKALFAAASSTDFTATEKVSPGCEDLQAVPASTLIQTAGSLSEGVEVAHPKDSSEGTSDKDLNNSNQKQADQLNSEQHAKTQKMIQQRGTKRTKPEAVDKET